MAQVFQQLLVDDATLQNVNGVISRKEKSVIIKETQVADGTSDRMVITDLDHANKGYDFIGDGFQLATALKNLYFQVSVDNGASWRATPSEYLVNNQGVTTSSLQPWEPTPPPYGGIPIGNNGAAARQPRHDGDQTFNFSMRANKLSAGKKRTFIGDVAYQNPAGGNYVGLLMGIWNLPTGDINAIRFISESGNITTGHLTVREWEK